MSGAILTRRLSKDYGSGRGLFELTLEIAPGEVFGYLGPNGSGKTTTIRLLMGMIHPTAGSAEVLGMDALRDAAAIKRRVGYMPGELPQFGGLRGSQVVGYFAGLRGGVDPHRVQELTERFDLDLGMRFREYSRGNKQKLGLVLALMHRPDLVILDEPTNGLDPLNQQEFFGLVSELKREGVTVFLSSHILSEVEHVCDRAGIIREGRLVKVAGLRDLHEIRFHHVEVEFAGPAPVDALRAAGLDSVAVQDGHVTGDLRGDFDPLLRLLAGEHVVSFASHEPSLEEAFLAYYGRLGDAAEAAVLKP